MSHLTIAARIANPVLTAWAAVAGGLFDKAYEAHGYTKHDMRRWRLIASMKRRS